MLSSSFRLEISSTLARREWVGQISEILGAQRLDRRELEARHRSGRGRGGGDFGLYARALAGSIVIERNPRRALVATLSDRGQLTRRLLDHVGDHDDPAAGLLGARGAAHDEQEYE